jgi:hypothetical protein
MEMMGKWLGAAVCFPLWLVNHSDVVYLTSLKTLDAQQFPLKLK